MLQYNISSQSSIFSIAAYRIVVWLENRAAKAAAWKTRRETFKTLHKLSDRELNDIGISRGDIRSIANDTWEDNRNRDAFPYTPVNQNLRGSV
jgi:uncharacterized protein YjiS (DUF1127 family)